MDRREKEKVRAKTKAAESDKAKLELSQISDGVKNESFEEKNFDDTKSPSV